MLSTSWSISGAWRHLAPLPSVTRTRRGPGGRGGGSASELVEAEVRELVRRRGLDPVAEPSAVRRLVDEVIAEYDERSLSAALPPLPDPREAARSGYDAVAGFRPPRRPLDNPAVEDIWINAPDRVFVARRGRSELTTTILTEGQVRDLVER